MGGPNELNVYDEYGVPQAPELDNRPVGAPTPTDTTQLFVLNYGSLGQPQRETTDTGIQFMGARGYNLTTGQFLTPDPIPGGNETPYNYPNDPICRSDLSGFADESYQIFNFLITIGVDAVVIAACASFPPACLAISIGAGAASGALQGYLECVQSGHTGQDQFNDIMNGAVIGVVASGIGATLATPAIKGTVQVIRGPIKQSIKRVVKKYKLSSEYVVGKVIESSMTNILERGRTLSDRRKHGMNLGAL